MPASTYRRLADEATTVEEGAIMYAVAHVLESVARWETDCADGYMPREAALRLRRRMESALARLDYAATAWEDVNRF